MNLQLKIIPHTLKFKFDARTSRGAMQEHQVYYFKLFDTRKPEIFGLGECAPLPGLSPEYTKYFTITLNKLIKDLNQKIQAYGPEYLFSVHYLEIMDNFPSVIFALETAWLDLKNNGQRLIYDNAFSRSQAGIPINGLIWMGDKAFMQEQIRKKLQEGYSCLKLKIGGLDFNTELEILNAIRQVAPAGDLSIRVDANGAFSPQEALSKLGQLAVFGLHSIEQPIKAGNWIEMQQICRESPIAVALDEELIGLKEPAQKLDLVQTIGPAYLIFKPTLLGGLQETAGWINLAEANGIDWWITSALESNIGLNAISQFTAQYPVTREQGLGTGQLYHNNLDSPLTISQGQLIYDQNKNWNLHHIIG